MELQIILMRGGCSWDAFSAPLEQVCENMAKDIQTTSGEIKAVLNNWPVKSNKDDKTVILVRKVE